jgi:hypothetical protein
MSDEFTTEDLEAPFTDDEKIELYNRLCSLDGLIAFLKTDQLAAVEDSAVSSSTLPVTSYPQTQT